MPHQFSWIALCDRRIEGAHVNVEDHSRIALHRHLLTRVGNGNVARWARKVIQPQSSGATRTRALVLYKIPLPVPLNVGILCIKQLFKTFVYGLK